MIAKWKSLSRNRKWILIFLGIAVVGCFGTYVWLDSLPKVVGPKNRIELCETLGKDPEKEANCQEGTPLIPLLESVFPPGVATRQQVRDVLGDYFDDTSVYVPGGNSDYYRYNMPLFSLFKEYVMFTFDEEDVLIVIRGG